MKRYEFIANTWGIIMVSVVAKNKKEAIKKAQNGEFEEVLGTKENIVVEPVQKTITEIGEE